MAYSQISRRRMAAFLGLGLPSLFGARPALAGQDASGVLTQQTRPLDLVRRLTVPVRINDLGPYPFLVDTGANASVISNDLAAALDLPVGQPVNLHSIAGVEMVGTVNAARVSVGRRVRRDLALSVLPGRFVRAPGVLGLDWLGSQGLVLDFARQELRLGSIVPKVDGMTISVPVKMSRSGIYLIEASAAGGNALAFIDTGSTTTVGNAALMEMALRHAAVSSPWADVQLQSLTGQAMTGRLAALKAVNLGRIGLKNAPVVFGPVHTFEYWKLTDRPAILIGMDILAGFESVALDFNRGQVHFRLRSSSVRAGFAMS